MQERGERLDWDDWNSAHIEKHGVSKIEIESVVRGDPISYASYKNRFILIGPSHQGRMLAIVIGPVPGTGNTWYVFSARPASRKERARYWASIEETP